MVGGDVSTGQGKPVTSLAVPWCHGQPWGKSIMEKSSASNQGLEMPQQTAGKGAANAAGASSAARFASPALAASGQRPDNPLLWVCNDTQIAKVPGEAVSSGRVLTWK